MARAARFPPILVAVLMSLACACPLPSPWTATPVASPTITTEAAEAAEGVSISSGTTDSTGRTVAADSAGIEAAVVEVRDVDSEKPIAGIEVYCLKKGSRYLVVAVDPEGRYLASWREGFIDELGARSSSKDAVGSFVLPSAAHAQALPVVLILVKLMSTVYSLEDLGAYLQDPPDFEYWGVLYEERCWTGEQLANYVGASGLVIPAGQMEYFMEAIYLMSQHVMEQDLKEYFRNLERPVRIRTYHLGIPSLGMIPVGWCDEELTPTPTPTATATPALNLVCGAAGVRPILYATEERQISSMCHDGSLQRELTTIHEGRCTSGGDWSPDGEWIAFSRDSGHIFIMRPDGSDQRQLTSVGDNFEPSWSPDGEWIAFVRKVQSYGEIWAQRPDGSQETRITSEHYDVALSWSPDGEWIVFQRGLGLMSSADIFIIRADGSDLTRLTADGCNFEPTWSPDGGWIAFRRGSCGIEEVGGIFVMRPDGSQQTQLTFNEWDSSPSWSLDGQWMPFTPSLSWSPDGQSLAFTRHVLFYSDDISVVRRDGPEETKLTFTDYFNEACPSWSPDGQWIAFLCDRSDEEPHMQSLDNEIFIMRPDGSQRTQVTFNTDDEGCPRW
jgi:Tol biopolymer transport system component